MHTVIQRRLTNSIAHFTVNSNFATSTTTSRSLPLLRSSALHSTLPHTRTIMTSTATSASTTTTQQQPQSVDIQIISDNICPFCYLGKKKIESAVAQLPAGTKVNFDWRPFQLDPTLPADKGVNKMERYRSKFGAGRMEGMLTQMKENGRKWGINFSYGGNVGNTLNSHRLIEFSKLQENGGGAKTDQLINILFNSYFENEKDISDIDTLVEIWSKAGLDQNGGATKEKVKSFLQSDALRSEVLDNVNAARQAEISGVPHFIINGKYSISGAQEPETFVKVFKKIGVM